MNNQECKIRPEMINVNSNVLLFLSFCQELMKQGI